jgi:2-polyprenyl-6-hydroxyphenyl methylase/3-demethylubiquinone-9 3-methyltransferase
MEDLDKDERIFLKTKGSFACSRRRFRFIFPDWLRNCLRSVVYRFPTFLRCLDFMISFTSATENQNPAFWDSELMEPKAWYLGGTLCIKMRRSIIVQLIRHTIPDLHSMLDVGCAAGGLAETAFREGLQYYVGVDISEYAIKKAKKQVLKGKRIYSSSFYTCNLCDFSPENDSQFDVIVFNEVLYYLDIKEAVVQLERYANWLQPEGVFCISMKNDPKSRAIYRAIMGQFQEDRYVLFQVGNGPPGYRITTGKKSIAFAIGIFRPKDSQGKLNRLA